MRWRTPESMGDHGKLFISVRCALAARRTARTHAFRDHGPYMTIWESWETICENVEQSQNVQKTTNTSNKPVQCDLFFLLIIIKQIMLNRFLNRFLTHTLTLIAKGRILLYRLSYCCGQSLVRNNKGQLDKQEIKKISIKFLDFEIDPETKKHFWLVNK